MKFDPRRGQGGDRARAGARRAGLLRPQPRRSIHAMEQFLQELVPDGARRRGARADGRGQARGGDGRLHRDRELDVLLAHLDHRERHRHPERQHHHREPRRPLRARAALPDPRPRGPQPGARLRVPARAGAAPGDARTRSSGSRCCSASPSWARASRIASHDLEIRGAGNLLGKDQSGPDRGGRLRPLRAAARRGGARAARASRRARRSTRTCSSRCRRFIPDDYMPDVHQRLVFYKRFAQAGTGRGARRPARRAGGPLRRAAGRGRRPLRAHAVKVRLRALRIRALEAGPGRLVLTLGETAALDPFLLAKHVQALERARSGSPRT